MFNFQMLHTLHIVFTADKTSCHITLDGKEYEIKTTKQDCLQIALDWANTQMVPTVEPIPDNVMVIDFNTKKRIS